MSTARLISTLLLAGSLLHAPLAAADGCSEGPDCYRVELIAFGYPDAQKSDSQWPRTVQMGYPSPVRALRPPEAAGDGAALAALPAEQRRLNAEAARLAQGNAAKILFHEAWNQRLGSAAAAESVLVTGGEQQGTHRALEGSVKLWLERTPHVEAWLWLSKVGPQPISMPAAAPPAESASLEEELDPAATGPLWPERPPLPEANAPAADPIAPAATEPTRIVVLRQHSALGPGALHYLDHPLFGVLVQVTPLDSLAAPSAGSAAAAATGGAPAPSAPQPGSGVQASEGAGQ